MIHPDQNKPRLEKALRRFPDARIEGETYDATIDGFKASIKRGRKTSIFVVTGLEILQNSSDGLDRLISDRLTMAMLRN